MAVLPIRIFPDEVLRTRCAQVESFDDELARLAADMVETMQAAPGVGLAAPQVGADRRLFVVDLSVGEDPAQLHVFVNPRVVEEEGLESEVEGCLSIPGISEKVDRPRRVRVEARGLDGRPFTLEAEDWLARAICHENDHLDGVLFVDRLRGLRREKVRRQLRRMVREQEPAEVTA
jgi:peptide deformylase